MAGAQPNSTAGKTHPSYIAAMRVWLILLLTLSFALQGWAAAQPSIAPCPMQAEMAMADMAPDPTADNTMTGDCCHDMATALLTGQVCKTGQDCQTPLATVLLPQPEKVAAAVRQTVSMAHKPMAPSALDVAVWRPPSSD
jgi:hypothetical protein